MIANIELRANTKELQLLKQQFEIARGHNQENNALTNIRQGY